MGEEERAYHFSRKELVGGIRWLLALIGLLLSLAGGMLKIYLDFALKMDRIEMSQESLTQSHNDLRRDFYEFTRKNGR